MIQNHMLQVVACLAMEAPMSGAASSLRDATTRLLQSIVPLDPASVIRGQFRGYRQVPGVAANSQVETFAAVRLSIESWRWAGVPFFIRAGKCMPVTATEVLVRLRPPPVTVFDPGSLELPHSNHLRFRLGPDVATALGVRSKEPGEAMVGKGVELLAVRDVAIEMLPYERLLGDAMAGDPTLFATEEGVEASWRVVDPIVDERARVVEYEPGTWGPPAANTLIARDGGWHDPAPSTGAAKEGGSPRASR